MSPIRYREDDPSLGGIMLGLTFGTLAGFAMGVIVAQEAGGIPGVVKVLRRGLAVIEEQMHGADVLGEDDDEYGDDDLDDDLDDAELDEELDDEEFAGGADGSSGEDELAPGAVDDMSLEEHVLDALEEDPVLSERAIDIGAIRDGIIELSGFVSTPEEADLATRVVERVAGVESVVNRLEVGGGL
ncbi:MAG: BON domain-containing protein [Gemmatimonadaceae bacterium]